MCVRVCVCACECACEMLGYVDDIPVIHKVIMNPSSHSLQKHQHATAGNILVESLSSRHCSMICVLVARQHGCQRSLADIKVCLNFVLVECCSKK